MKNLNVTSRIFFALIIALIIILSGCAAPKRLELPSNITEEEIKIIALVREGESYLGQGRYDQAEKRYRKAISLNNKRVAAPDNTAFLLALTQALDGSGQFEEASEIIGSLIKKNPQDKTLKVRYANHLADNKQYKEALKILDGVLEEPDLLSGGAARLAQETQRYILALEMESKISEELGMRSKNLCALTQLVTYRASIDDKVNFIRGLIIHGEFTYAKDHIDLLFPSQLNLPISFHLLSIVNLAQAEYEEALINQGHASLLGELPPNEERASNIVKLLAIKALDFKVKNLVGKESYQTAKDFWEEANFKQLFPSSSANEWPGEVVLLSYRLLNS